MRRFALGLCLVLSLAACKKKSAKEFYRLESDVQVMVARDGDDAWVAPEMDAVEQALQGIPADVLEAQRVQALLAKVQAERARVLGERDAEKKARDAANAANAAPAEQPGTGMAAAPSDAPPTEAPAEDAGVVFIKPELGMTEAQFLGAFGSCFSAGPAVAAPGGLAGTSQVVKSDAECEKRFGEAGVKTSYVFVDGKLHGKQSETPGKVESIDAGRPPPKPVPPAPPPTLLMQGAPVPADAIPAPGSPNSQ